MSKDFDTLTMLREKAKDHLDEGELKDIAMSTITISESDFNEAYWRLRSAKATLACLAAALREGVLTDEFSSEAVHGLTFTISDICEFLNKHGSKQ